MIRLADYFTRPPFLFYGGTFTLVESDGWFIPVQDLPLDHGTLTIMCLLDIGLPDKTEGDVYLKTLEQTLPRLIREHQPDLIFYLSGVDVLETDRLGRLSLSVQACKERDRFVFNTCKAAGIPVAVSMGGGYSRKVASIIEGHANTYRVASEIFE